MKKLFAFVLSVIMMLFAVSCSSDVNSGYTVSTVNMTYVKTPLNVPSIVEKYNESFESAYEKMGLGFSYSVLTSGPEQVAALASGDIQILNAVGNTSVILSASNGSDIKIIGMYSTSPKGFRLFSSDVSIKSPSDLKGKTIAGPKGTVLHELLAAFLKSGGLTLNDVNFASMSVNEAYAALEGGSVDCALLTGAIAFKCEKSGYNLVTDGEGLISGAIVSATTQKFYDNNKEIIDTYLSVQNETIKYMEENKNEVIALAAKEIEMDDSLAMEMYDYYDFRTEITEDDIKSLQNTADFMLDAGLLENPVEISKILLEK